jgi:addiction module RelB/DinJ family antitoxin
MLAIYWNLPTLCYNYNTKSNVGRHNMQSATLNSRIGVEDKDKFIYTTEALGLTPSCAINVFVKKFNECGGFPFDVRLEAKPFTNEEEACNFVDEMASEMISDAW